MTLESYTIKNKYNINNTILAYNNSNFKKIDIYNSQSNICLTNLYLDCEFSRFFNNPTKFNAALNNNIVIHGSFIIDTIYNKNELLLKKSYDNNIDTYYLSIIVDINIEYPFIKRLFNCLIKENYQNNSTFTKFTKLVHNLNNKYIISIEYVNSPIEDYLEKNEIDIFQSYYNGDNIYMKYPHLIAQKNSFTNINNYKNHYDISKYISLGFNFYFDNQIINHLLINNSKKY